MMKARVAIDGDCASVILTTLDGTTGFRGGNREEEKVFVYGKCRR
jgi:hypothetical protein